jgi:hypothetical protein
MNRTTDLSLRLTALTLGLDGLFRRERGGGGGKLDSEGLVPVHWSPVAPEPVEDWPRAREALLGVVESASTLTDPWARDWLAEQALALLTLSRWFAGETLSYEELVAGALRIDPAPPSARAIAVHREARDRALVAAGLPPGARGYAAYLERDGVARGDVARAMSELLDQARARSSDRLRGLAIPAEPIGVRVVDGTPFTAYCDYPGRTVWINTDVGHTRSGLKHLVGHEAYPGHYVHMGHREALVQAGAMLPDAAVVVTNTASSVLFEGLAEIGLDLLGLRDDAFDQVAWTHNRLQWICSIEVAHGLNTGRIDSVTAARFLREECDGDEAWIDGKLRFVTHRLRAPFVYTYWWGGTVAGRWWSRIAAGDREAAVAHLYSRMHSPATLEAHWPAARNGAQGDLA